MTLADRLPPIPPAQWTAQQRMHAQAIIDGPRGALISSAAARALSSGPAQR